MTEKKRAQPGKKEAAAKKKPSSAGKPAAQKAASKAKKPATAAKRPPKEEEPRPPLHEEQAAESAEKEPQAQAVEEKEEKVSEEDFRRLVEESLEKVKVSDIVLAMMNELASMGYMKLGLPESVNRKYRDFDQASLAIDALESLIKGAEGKIAEDALRPFRSTLANLQMNFVQLRRA